GVGGTSVQSFRLTSGNPWPCLRGGGSGRIPCAPRRARSRGSCSQPLPRRVRVRRNLLGCTLRSPFFGRILLSDPTALGRQERGSSAWAQDPGCRWSKLHRLCGGG